jgi:hypothetical protein
LLRGLRGSSLNEMAVNIAKGVWETLWNLDCSDWLLHWVEKPVQGREVEE